MPGPQLGQIHMRSRLSFAFTVPRALQVRLLGNHMGRVTWVCSHWPLASSSRASTQYPRHLARALDFPGSAHPRQEGGGATLTQHGVTVPGDDAGHVDLEGNHQVGDQDSFRQRRATGPVSPSMSGMARAGPSREHRPPAWGQHGFFTRINTLVTGFTFRSCWASTRRRPFRLQLRAFRFEDLASPAIRGGGPWKWHPDFTPRDLVKQLLRYGRLPRRMVRLLGLVAEFRVGHPWGTPQASISW